MPALMVNSTFIETVGLKIIAGRGYKKEIKTDDSLGIVINESMVKYLGWGTPQNALGKKFSSATGNERVIGVINDFNFEELNQPVGPFFLDMSPMKQRIIWVKYLLVRITGQDKAETIKFIEKQWGQFIKEFPFDYFFLSDALKKQYKPQDNLGKLVAYFSILAIFIACLGLFALSAFTSEQRTKEIGIRKVLGASISTISLLLSKDFLKLVLISNLIAWPVAFYLMNSWLNNFAFRINISFDVFIISSFVALLIALMTVAFQAVKAALNNPVRALKYE
jgi:putative ABC transport system permease protein